MNKKAKNNKAKKHISKGFKSKKQQSKVQKSKRQISKRQKGKSTKNKGIKSKRLFSNGIQESKKNQCKWIVAGVVHMGKKMVIYLYIWNHKSDRLEILREWTSNR